MWGMSVAIVAQADLPPLGAMHSLHAASFFATHPPCLFQGEASVSQTRLKLSGNFSLPASKGEPELGALLGAVYQPVLRFARLSRDPCRTKRHYPPPEPPSGGGALAHTHVERKTPSLEGWSGLIDRSTIACTAFSILFSHQKL